MNESVKLSGFTPSTYDFIAGFIEEWHGTPALSFARPTYVQVGVAAEAFFRFRAMPESVFPGGKWATLQHLEGLIEAALRQDASVDAPKGAPEVPSDGAA